MTAPPGTPHPKHIGILVIHGIGEENAYGTLDQFGRGLYSYFQHEKNGPLYTMKTQWKERGSDPSHKQQSWIQAQIGYERHHDADITGFPSAPERITVAEYYWSPVTKGKIKDVEVLTWLFRAALEPFRYISENIQAMVAASPGRVDPKLQAETRHNLALREMLRLVLLYPLFLGSLMALAGFLAGVPELGSVLKTVAASPKNIVIGLFLAARLLILVSLGGYFLNFFKWRRYRSPQAVATLTSKHWDTAPDPGRRYNMELFVWAIAFSLALLFVPTLLAQAWRFPPLLPDGHLAQFKDYGWTTRLLHHFFPTQDHLWRLFATLPAWLRQLWDWFLAWISQFVMLTAPFTSPRITIPLAELAIAGGIRSFLINFAGDVAIYTNLNQRSSNFSIRSQILEECGHALTSLYTDLREAAIDDRALGGKDATKENREAVAKTLPAEDFQIVVAAHSLGTVIAYDTICDLFNRARIGGVAPGAPAPDPGQIAGPTALDVCSRLRGMLTFGSPLNKTYYFFRDQSEAQELIRAQLVDGLHFFLQASPATNLPGAPLDPVSIPPNLQQRIDAFRWVNVWSRADIISGELFFYKATTQYERAYRVPILAHLSYWNDKEVYGYLAKHLL